MKFYRQFAFSRTLPAIVGIATFANGLPSQIVRGTVRDVAGLPVPAAFVQLLDSASNVAAQAATDEAGRYSLAASNDATYRLRTLRIGFAPALTAPFRVDAGQDVTRDLTVRRVVVALDTVTVAGKSVCRSSDNSGAAAFTLWDQARAALAATAAARADSSIAETAVLFARIRDVRGDAIRAESFMVRADSGHEPWLAASIDALHARGYAVSDAADSVTFRAPGLDMLSSDRFIEDHCFRIVKSADTAQIGIAFEPSSSRGRIPEIAGTLWLVRSDVALRAIDFTYVNADRLTAGARAGGSMSFARSRDGTWMIAHWSLSMPVLQRVIETDTRGGRFSATPRVSAAALREVGGDLLMLRRGTDTLWRQAPIVIRGTVQDSASLAPIADAAISVIGETWSTRSDGDGRFVLRDVPPGAYDIEVRTASLDSVHAVQRTPIVADAGSKPLALRVPSASTVAAGMCAGSPSSASSGLIFGMIARPDSSRLATPRVDAEWIDASTGERKRATTTADAAGRFSLCRIPFGTTVSLYARAGALESEPVEIVVSPRVRFAAVTVPLDSLPTRAATFSGIVVDSAGRPLSGVEIAMPALRKSLITGEKGDFVLREVPAGETRVTARKIGWGALDTAVTFSAGERIDRKIVLSPAAILGTVETRAVAGRLNDFENNRRIGLGHFFTAEDVERERPAVTAQLLSETSGMRVIRSPDGRAFVVTSRGPTSLAGTTCGPSRLADVYLDGVRMYSGRPGEQPFDVNSIDPQSIAGIEYYAGPAQTPGRYQNLNTICGVLVIWTKR